MEYRFSVGDKVKVVMDKFQCSVAPKLKLGEIYTVASIELDAVYIDISGKRWIYAGCRFEPVNKPKKQKMLTW